MPHGTPSETTLNACRGFPSSIRTCAASFALAVVLKARATCSQQTISNSNLLVWSVRKGTPRRSWTCHGTGPQPLWQRTSSKQRPTGRTKELKSVMTTLPSLTVTKIATAPQVVSAPILAPPMLPKLTSASAVTSTIQVTRSICFPLRTSTIPTSRLSTLRRLTKLLPTWISRVCVRVSCQRVALRPITFSKSFCSFKRVCSLSGISRWWVGAKFSFRLLNPL